MSDEPTERDVESRARLVRWFSEHLTHDTFMKSTDDDFADAFLTSDWYAERIAEARREGATRGRTPDCLPFCQDGLHETGCAALRSDA